MRRKLKKIRRYLMSKEYDGFVYKATIIFMYKLWLVLKGRYSTVKENLSEIIEKNVSSETFANKKFVNKTINDILYCKFNYGIKYEEYFIYSFHLLSHEGRKKYVGLTYKYPLGLNILYRLIFYTVNNLFETVNLLFLEKS